MNNCQRCKNPIFSDNFVYYQYFHYHIPCFLKMWKIIRGKK